MDVMIGWDAVGVVRSELHDENSFDHFLVHGKGLFIAVCCWFVVVSAIDIGMDCGLVVDDTDDANCCCFVVLFSRRL